MTTVRAFVHDRRIDIPAPEDLPDGTEVVLTIGTPHSDNGPLPPSEIAMVLAAMNQLEPLELSLEEAADLDAWERRLNEHGIQHTENGIKQVFP